MAPLPYEELIDRIRLARTLGIGAKTFHQLLQRFGAAREAIAHLPGWGGRHKTTDILPPAAAEKEYAAAMKAGLHYVATGDPHYPEPLAALDDAPPLLVVKGNIAALSRPLIAMV